MRRFRTGAGAALWVLINATGLGAHEANLGSKIRAYILENPEVIVEALAVLSDREARVALAQQLSAYPGLFTETPVLGIGAPDAPIRVVEFFDYRCAPCKAMHPKLRELVAQEPDLRIEMRQLPILSPGSERAARFALATLQAHGAGAYARVHHRLWTLRGPMTGATFERIAEAEGLDFPRLETLMDSDVVSNRIAENRDIAIDLGLMGTPGFVTASSVSFGSADVSALADVWLRR